MIHKEVVAAAHEVLDVVRAHFPEKGIRYHAEFVHYVYRVLADSLSDETASDICFRKPEPGAGRCRVCDGYLDS